MNTKTIITAFAIIFLSCHGYSQSMDSLKTIYNKRILWFNKSQYIIGNNTYRLNQLEKEFAESKEGLQLYLKARKNLHTGRAMIWASLAGYIVAAAVAKKDNSTPFWAVFGSSLGVQLAGSGFVGAGTNQMNQAIFIRNRDVLFKQ